MPLIPTLVVVGQGGVPKVQAAMELYNILSESNTDLRQPVGLEEQLLKDEALDSEVGQSMLQLLQVLHAESAAGAQAMCAERSSWQDLASAWQLAPMLHGAVLYWSAFVYAYSDTLANQASLAQAALHCLPCTAALHSLSCIAALPCTACLALLALYWLARAAQGLRLGGMPAV